MVEMKQEYESYFHHKKYTNSSLELERKKQ